MPKPTDYDKTHLRNMAAIGTRIDRIFKKAAEEAAKIGVSIKDLPEDRIFTFDDYPATQKQIERLMTALQQSMETTIVNGVRSSWTLSNNKNNALVSRIFGDRVCDLSKEQYKRYFSTNGAALEAFLQRREQGLNLSDRVWRYTTAFKREIELGLDLGIRSGESAAKMTRSLRQYLQHPDKLFRRVRDKHGNLKLSKAAAEFHPGRGVYRSSYKNARRLAATETNIAYRTSDHLRWQQMDFVVGIEIKLSNNHTLNGVPLTDICDTLAGRYPKDFKFVGWHPHCRCKAITVLKTEDEMAEDTSRILDGQQPTKSSVNTVRDVPAAFKDWIEERKDRIEMGGNLPYFIKDNRKRVDAILGHEPEVAKSPLEIAKERHEARTPAQAAAIQQAWNERRIANIQQAIADGYLPKECAEGLSSLPQEQFNDRIAFLQQRAKKHAERTPEQIQAIKDAWAKRVKEHERIKRHGDMVLALAKTWNEVDYSALEALVAQGKLTGMEAETRKVMDALKAMRAEEKALSDLIPDVHGWHKMFTLDELKEAHGSIQSTLDFWKTKYGADLATDSNLAKLQSELEQKIKFVENPGAFKKGAVAKKYWQVTQDSYIKLLDQVETRIQIVDLDKEYKALLGFKTTSKDFKMYMANAKKMLDDGDPVGAKMWLNYANSKKGALEARRGAAKGSATSDKYYSDFTEAQAKEAKRLEKQIFDALGNIDWYDDDARRQLSKFCDQYAQHIETVSEGLFPMQKSIYTAAERKEFEKQMRKYLKEKGIHPNYIWGGEIGGVWDSLSWARDSMAKALGTVTADELSLCTRFSSGMTFYNAYNLRNTSEYFREVWRSKLKMLRGSNGKVKLKDIRDQYRIIEEYTQALNGLQDKMMRYRGITFRAVHSQGGKELLDTFNDCWTNGKAWKNNAAASTSKDIMVSINHFDDRGNYDVIMIIRNKTGCNIQPISEYGYEKEVMIIKDREYRLLGKPKKIGGKYFVELEEI